MSQLKILSFFLSFFCMFFFFISRQNYSLHLYSQVFEDACWSEFNCPTLRRRQLGKLASCTVNFIFANLHSLLYNLLPHPGIAARFFCLFSIFFLRVSFSFSYFNSAPLSTPLLHSRIQVSLVNFVAFLLYKFVNFFFLFFLIKTMGLSLASLHHVSSM